MHLLSSHQFKDCIENVIHEDTQLDNNSVDLTINTINQFTKPGSLDFGGNEFEPAGNKSITPEKQNAGDDYGWWKLVGGTYKTIFNEELLVAENQLLLIMLHDHAQKAGLSGNTSLITENGSINFLFQVPECGCNIKENARIATAFFIET